MTSRELTTGFDFWSHGHLCVASVHLPMKFGADIFIQSGIIDIFPKLKMAAAAILDLFGWAVIGVSFCIWLPNLVQIGAPTVEIWRHIHFLIWRPQPLNTTSGFVFVDVTAFRGSKSISKQISSRYLHRWLRYNYFRFPNTDVRHIGILLPVSITTSWP